MKKTVYVFWGGRRYYGWVENERDIIHFSYKHVGERWCYKSSDRSDGTPTANDLRAM